MATDEPVTIAERAIERCSGRTTCTAATDAIDQNTACAQATPMRAAISAA